MKKLHLLALTVIALVAAPVASFAAPTWTSVASAGATIDEASISKYMVDGGDLFFNPAKGGELDARYNVVNTSNLNQQTPPWTTLEIGYTDASPFGIITAILYEVDPCTGDKVSLCAVTSIDNAFATCETCTFPNNSFDFTNNLYFVDVQMTRSNQGANPILHTLRIH